MRPDGKVLLLGIYFSSKKIKPKSPLNKVSHSKGPGTKSISPFSELSSLWSIIDYTQSSSDHSWSVNKEIAKDAKNSMGEQRQRAKDKESKRRETMKFPRVRSNRILIRKFRFVYKESIYKDEWVYRLNNNILNLKMLQNSFDLDSCSLSWHQFRFTLRIF